ncbi:sterol-binding protein [Pseudoduganella sp. FT25W]|jgi:ubiquinone biosynthesis protein UbiJ|uniref:Ubiquinone biosynthesis accessory factor UbiJ n=1 Tax=Duganella alba TaxID=2666081 RepID=A0A6L5QF13_9BURK|nr:SCP2 sterol-binding domain-containing protein [Duganella alba]MRX08108.1 sterol-binding protein [Duganella alba]MRX16355.1 sterol-binding protein [Duganella alba]
MNPGSFSAAPASAAINHLLAQEPWARQELQRHAGKTASIDAGSVALRLRVTADGYLEPAPADEAARVTIRVKLSDVPLILQNRDRAFSYVQIEGDAEFANAISSLSKSLRWEAEHDLEKVVGPIAAVRAVSGARAAFEAVKNGHQKLAENVAEFLLDEKQVLVRPQTVEAYSADVTRLRDDVERAAKRLAKLEQKLGSQ